MGNALTSLWAYRLIRLSLSVVFLYAGATKLADPRAFAALIRAYASNSAHDRLSEYMHLGPATNLEVGTWEQPDITDQGIAGSLPDLLNLAGLIELNVRANVVGRRIALRSSYSPLAPYDLILDVRDEAFDPASADPTCSEG